MPDAGRRGSRIGRIALVALLGLFAWLGAAPGGAGGGPGALPRSPGPVEGGVAPAEVADLLACERPGGGFSYVCDPADRAGGVTAVMRHAERIAGLLGLADWDLLVLRSPGTPAAGLALLAAFHHGAPREARDAALRAADVLVATQLPSGGWFSEMPVVDGGLSWWFPRVVPGDTLDDDVTPGAVRLLLAAWAEAGSPDHRAAAERGLELLLRSQLAGGGWPLTARPAWRSTVLPSFEDLPSTNDAATTAVILTLIEAAEALRRPDLLAAARRGGEWLLAVQGKGEQAAWAQQFDRDGHPAPGRRFEPAAWATWETRQVVDALDALARATGDRRFCRGVGPAIDWLARSELRPGCWARFRSLDAATPVFVDARGRGTDDLGQARHPYRWVGDFGIPATLQRLGAAGSPGRPAADAPAPLRIPGDPGACPGESPLEARAGSDNPRVRIVRLAVAVGALAAVPTPACPVDDPAVRRLAGDRRPG